MCGKIFHNFKSGTCSPAANPRPICIFSFSKETNAREFTNLNLWYWFHFIQHIGVCLIHFETYMWFHWLKWVALLGIESSTPLIKKINYIVKLTCESVSSCDKPVDTDGVIVLRSNPETVSFWIITQVHWI